MIWGACKHGAAQDRSREGRGRGGSAKPCEEEGDGGERENGTRREQSTTTTHKSHPRPRLPSPAAPRVPSATLSASFRTLGSPRLRLVNHLPQSAQPHTQRQNISLPPDHLPQILSSTSLAHRSESPLSSGLVLQVAVSQVFVSTHSLLEFLLHCPPHSSISDPPMPALEHPPQKKRKLESSSRQSYKYSSPSDIRRVFKAQSETALIEGLTALRNQLTIHPNDRPVQVNDERLLLVKAWLDEDSGAQDLFAAWQDANQVCHCVVSL